MNLFTIALLSIGSELVAFAAGIAARKHLDAGMKLLVVYLGFEVVMEIVLMVLAIHHQRTIWFVNVMMPYEYLALALVFSSWQRNAVMRKVLLLSIPAFLAICLATFAYSGDYENPNIYVQSLARLLIIAIAAYTLFTLNQTSGDPVFSPPKFWASIATLIYFGATFFWAAFMNAWLGLPAEIAKIIYLINPLSIILSSILYTCGFLSPIRNGGKIVVASPVNGKADSGLKRI